jgi:hypothetical protein
VPIWVHVLDRPQIETARDCHVPETADDRDARRLVAVDATDDEDLEPGAWTPLTDGGDRPALDRAPEHDAVN